MPGLANENSDIRTSQTINDTLNLVGPCSTAQTAVIHITSTSSLAGVFEGTMDRFDDPTVTADWFPLPSLIINTSGVTRKDPGATITPTDDDVLAASTMGARFYRFRRTAGSGTANLSVTNALLSEITEAAASGGAGGDATAANQTTMITHLSEIEGAVETLEAVDFALEAKQDTQITSLQLIDDFIAGTLGAVGPQLREVAVTFSMAAEAHSAGDVLADSQIMNSVVRATDAKGYLVGFQLLDKDDQAAAQIDVVFLSANVSLGTEGSAVSISDADAVNILGIVSVPSTAWCDLINSKLASIGMSNPMSGGIGGLPLPIIPVTGTDDIYVGLIARGTPTVTASGMTGRFFFADGR